MQEAEFVLEARVIAESFAAGVLERWRREYEPSVRDGLSYVIREAFDSAGREIAQADVDSMVEQQIADARDRHVQPQVQKFLECMHELASGMLHASSHEPSPKPPRLTLIHGGGE